MKITILGAAGGEVTESSCYVQTSQASVLVDCGLFQGGKKSEALNRPPTGPKQRLDAVLITHRHLDHTGRLPLLTRRGHRVPVFATPATIEMSALILRDSARIQAGDAERQNRKCQRAGEPPGEPLYTPRHTEEADGRSDLKRRHPDPRTVSRLWPTTDCRPRRLAQLHTCLSRKAFDIED